jgi:chloride channel protein, CIC family
MISNLISLFISSRFQKEPIYEVLAQQDGIHLPSSHTRSLAGQRPVAQAMRPAGEVLQVPMTVQEACDRVASSQLRAWPVVNDTGLIGMVSLAMLEKALSEGGSSKGLGELIEPGDFPHLHIDHSMNLALERMGSTHLDVLPIVSRANIHKLEGIVVLNDVLQFYGFAPKPATQPGSASQG